MKFISFSRYHREPSAGKNRFHFSVLTTVIIGLILTGCMVGPDYTRITPEAPSKWHTEPSGGLTAGKMNPETLAHWWSTLKDPQLSILVERALKGNLDLKNAQARIRQARALRGISRARFFPTLDAGASASRRRGSKNVARGEQVNLYSNLYSAGFDAGWELDIFGGIRRSVEAAQANLEATQEDLHQVLVSLLAEVALNYVEMRTFQARLAVIKANIKTQQDSYDLNLSRYQAGLVDNLAVQESLRILESSRSAIPTLETGLEATKNRLAVLLGEQAGKLSRELAAKQSIPALPPTAVVGIPAETLRHRPDIRRAERNLAAQTARIGVATAELYPKFHLIGSIGLESVTFSDFSEWASRTWSIGGPGISWNVFRGGAIRQNIKVQTALQEQALIQYESTVLRALEEVENALVAYAKEQRRQESLTKATIAAKRAAALAQDVYEAGLVDFNNVLDAQRALLLIEDQLAQSEGAVTSNLVRLYKALGGGWKSWKPDGA
jgi:NodT family efflux transporter outer membrane factor (OMF) lipoprotein